MIFSPPVIPTQLSATTVFCTIYTPALFVRLYWNLKSALYPVMRINRTGLESALFGKSAGDVIKQFTGDDVIKHMNGDDVTKQDNIDACAEDDDDF